MTRLSYQMAATWVRTRGEEKIFFRLRLAPSHDETDEDVGSGVESPGSKAWVENRFREERLG